MQISERDLASVHGNSVADVMGDPPGVSLVIETATPHASIALVSAAGKIEQRGFKSDRRHNALLFEPLAELLGSPDVRGRIGLVLVGSGPGSYSGTRVGIAAAQGVAIAAACPAVALPSILAVAAASDGAPCLAIGDARRGSYWTAAIEGARLLAEPELCDEVELESRVAGAIRRGQTVFSFEDPLRFPLRDELMRRVAHEIPDAHGLWRAWGAADAEMRSRWAAEIPQPMYLRPPHITPAKRGGPLG
jgi:tRNA threonylcarbamoyl adenosine modification protein YeaZ